jgi:hypothetical protein
MDGCLRRIRKPLTFFDAPLLDVLRLSETASRCVEPRAIAEVISQIQAGTHLGVFTKPLVVLGIDTHADLRFKSGPLPPVRSVQRKVADLWIHDEVHGVRRQSAERGGDIGTEGHIARMIVLRTR